MKKRDEKRRKELYKKLSSVVKKLDYYEEIYPDTEISQDNRLIQSSINDLQQLSEDFYSSDVQKYISVILDIERSITEYEILTYNEIQEALYARDRLYLMSMQEVKNMCEISQKEYFKFYMKIKQSIQFAIVKNIRIICICNDYRIVAKTKRNNDNLKIYLDVINKSLQPLEL